MNSRFKHKKMNKIIDIYKKIITKLVYFIVKSYINFLLYKFLTINSILKYFYFFIKKNKIYIKKF